MCGRFVAASSPQLLAQHFAVDDVWVDATEPSYNVAPTEQVLIVRERDRDGEQQRVLSAARWGLVPSWAKDPSIGNRMINARAETLTTKSAYKRAFETHRCLVPADGFYEWKVVAPPATPKGRALKQPVFIHRRDGEPMAFAGLWAAWKVPEGVQVEGVGEDGWLRSCVIITTDANELLMPIHDRMPVVLPESEWEKWLDPAEHDTASLERLLVPAPDEQLELWPVSPLVNKPEHKGPEVAKPIDPSETDS
jgi:putative SOS response-associated peptidase YedK